MVQNVALLLGFDVGITFECVNGRVRVRLSVSATLSCGPSPKQKKKKVGVGALLPPLPPWGAGASEDQLVPFQH